LGNELLSGDLLGGGFPCGLFSSSHAWINIMKMRAHFTPAQS
jgi:hypothetical protein